MKKVLIITYYWPPSGGAGVQRWLKFAKYLPDLGWEPVILTVDENEASYAQKDESLLKEVASGLKVVRTKTFEPYNLYKKLSAKKEIPFGGFSNEKKLSLPEKLARFIRGNLFIPDPRRGWKPYATKSALNLIDENQIEVVITSGPPHSTHLIGNALKNRRKIKWIADFRDPWTDIYYYKNLYHSSLAKWYDRKLETKVLNNCDGIITVSHALKELLAKKIRPSNHSKISVITNGYDTSDFQDLNPVLNKKFTITYTGTISKSYRIENFVMALASLPDEIKEQIIIRFVGNVPEDIIALFYQNGLTDQLEIIGYVPHHQAVNYMAGASVLLMAIPDVPDNNVIITGKFFEYLAARRPILVIGPRDSEVSLILEETKAGQIIDYQDTEALLTYFKSAYNNFRGNNQNADFKCIDKYSRKNITQELAKKLNKIVHE
jgi:glycosyltransferase involved in cell wall biosynthesis